MQLSVLRAGDPHPDRLPVEVVERKGRGHPDTLCDAIAEEASLALSRIYLERFGRILHHNVDKVLLAAGRSAPRFGGGAVTEPAGIYIAGRATEELAGERVPVRELGAARDLLTNSVHGERFNREIAVDAIKEYLGVTIADPPPISMAETELAPYVGRYSRPFTDVVVTQAGGRLMIQTILKQGFPTPTSPVPPPPPPVPA
jgi:hypothetical protein